MISKNSGMSISNCEVTDISKYGLWILINEKEYYISFDLFPMLKNASVDKIFQVKYYPPDHLRWESLDIDIELDSLDKPDSYPLIFR